MLVCGAPIRVRTNRPENPRDGALRYCDPEHLQHINAVLKESSGKICPDGKEPLRSPSAAPEIADAFLYDDSTGG